MSCLNCGNDDVVVSETLTIAASASSDDDFNSQFDGIVMECDYDDHPHSLFRAIKAEEWDEVERILGMDGDSEGGAVGDGMWLSCGGGRYTGGRRISSLHSGNGPLSRSSLLAKTWIVRRNPDDRSIRWRITPLHAACVYDAPPHVLRMLIEAHPSAASLRDERGNLPLHVAYREGLDDEKVVLIRSAYPQAEGIMNKGGKAPRDYIVGRGGENDRGGRIREGRDYDSDYEEEDSGGSSLGDGEEIVGMIGADPVHVSSIRSQPRYSMPEDKNRPRQKKPSVMRRLLGGSFGSRKSHRVKSGVGGGQAGDYHTNGAGESRTTVESYSTGTDCAIAA